MFNSMQYTKIRPIMQTINKTGDMWLHIGQYNNNGQQRGQIKFMEI